VEDGPPLATDEVEVKRVYFIRHAKALDRELWHHEDALRPLTEAGYRQADALAAELRRAKIDRVVSSRAFRCVDTVWPLATALGLEVGRHDTLFEGNRAPAALSLMRRVRGRRVALCTHGDVMQEVLEQLEDDGVDLDGGIRLAKGAYWTFDLDVRGEIQSGVYHPAPRERAGG
jgi:phosphohistidine phosphatase SixA